MSKMTISWLILTIEFFLNVFCNSKNAKNIEKINARAYHSVGVLAFCLQEQWGCP